MATRPRSAPRRPSWFPVLAVLACLGGLAWPEVRRGLRGRLAPEPRPIPWVDPRDARVADSPPWTDPRWTQHLAAVLARHPPFPLAGADAADSLAALAAELAGLSFVERVERCEVAGERLALALALRKPVACIPARGEYALVDEDGVVLEGRWPVPPRLGKAVLPVIGPPDDPLFERARSGDWLVEPEHLDALDVALSLAEHLDEDTRAGLGRIVVDARAGRRASVAEPGVRLELEGGRVAYFGRPPAAGGPGELDPEAKWRALARALALFASDPEAHDWELVDLRWDRPDLALRRPPAPETAVVARGPERASARSAVSAPPAPSASPARSEDGRPRVR